jgi:hypothetical protein
VSPVRCGAAWWQARQIDLRQKMERHVGLTVSRPVDVWKQRWPTSKFAEGVRSVLAPPEPDRRLPLPVKLLLTHGRALRVCLQLAFFDCRVCLGKAHRSARFF